MRDTHSGHTRASASTDGVARVLLVATVLAMAPVLAVLAVSFADLAVPFAAGALTAALAFRLRARLRRRRLRPAVPAR